MVCEAELRGLGAEALRRGVAARRIVVVSAEGSEALEEWRGAFGPEFLFLSDPESKTIDAYGLLHPGAAPDGRDAARPATFVVGRDGIIVTARPARSVLDRPDPAESLDALAAAR